MSSKLAVQGLAVVFTFATVSAGCVDPEKQFESFGERVVDAPPEVEVDAPVVTEIPDVTGRFLLGLAPGIIPDKPFQFIAEVTFDESDGSPGISMVITPLGVDTRMPVGDPITTAEVAVSDTAQFDSGIGTEAAPAEIPGEANPVSGGDLTVVAVAHGTIRDADLFCGDVTGEVVNLGLDLEGSTFAAIRIGPDDIGDSLPPLVSACPADMPEDAGPADAMPDGPAADAGTDATN